MLTKKNNIIIYGSEQAQERITVRFTKLLGKKDSFSVKSLWMSCWDWQGSGFIFVCKLTETVWMKHLI